MKPQSENLKLFYNSVWDFNRTLFERCKNEQRSLVTTASKLVERKNCPAGTYILDTKSLLNLESTIVHLLLSHGVKLEPKKMLTRCVVCNGSIQPVHDENQKKSILQSYQALEDVNLEVFDVYQCNRCSQGYWWCEKPTSSASRVKSQARKLLELCIRGGVPIDDDLGMFSDIDVEKIRLSREELDKENCPRENRLDVFKWLQAEDLRNPLPDMASAYASKELHNETLHFTNVTYDFVGTLDYILYNTKVMKVTDRLYVPTTFEELNDLGIANGHLLPSYDWPSDHLAIGCRLSFLLNERSEKPTGLPLKSLKSSPDAFPPGPPLPVPWSGEITSAEDFSESEPKLPEPGTPSAKPTDLPLKRLKSSPVSFPPGPPMAVPWCGEITAAEDFSESKPKLLEPGTPSEKPTDLPLKRLKSSPDSFPPGPPMAVPWCGEITAAEDFLESEPKFPDPGTPPVDNDVSEKPEEVHLPHPDRCACGCIPPILSLFEMAELRRQHRLKLENGGQ